MNHSPLFMAATPDDVSDIAVAVMHVPEHDVPTGSGDFYGPFSHAGIIFRGAPPQSGQAGPLAMVHFVATGQIKLQPRKKLGKVLWAVPSAVLPAVRRQIGYLCEHIAASNRVVPYGFKDSDETYFINGAGDVNFGQGTIGFTCATFVLAIFRHFRQHLIDSKNWNVRTEDEEWQRQLVRYQKAIGIDPAIVQANESAAATGCYRYRPEEVVAACMHDRLRIGISDAAPLGAMVKQWSIAFSGIVDSR